jgi:hypothetical protein
MPPSSANVGIQLKYCTAPTNPKLIIYVTEDAFPVTEIT